MCLLPFWPPDVEDPVGKWAGSLNRSVRASNNKHFCELIRGNPCTPNAESLSRGYLPSVVGGWERSWVIQGKLVLGLPLASFHGVFAVVIF